MRRALAVATRLLAQLAGDRRALALVVVAPLAVMTLLAAVIGHRAPVPRVGIQAQGVVALFLRDMEERLGDVEDPDTRVEVVSVPDDMAPAEVIRQGLADAVLVFPSDFLERRVRGEAGQVDLHLDGADPLRTADVGHRLSESLSTAIGGMPRLLPADCDAHCGDTIPTAPPTLELRRRAGADIDDDIDFFTPVLPPFFVFFFVFLLSGLAFLRERTGGTAERLLASPLRRSELVVGYVLGFLPAALVQATITILFARFALGGPWGGAPVIVAVILLALAAECLGVFLSAFARSEFQVIQFVPLIILPQLLLSGMFWPVADLPAWLQPICRALPLTYAVDAVRDAALRGHGFAEVWPDLLALAGFAAGAVVLASISIRRTVRG